MVLEHLEQMRKEHNIGDIVYLIKRKANGFPKSILDNIPYTIQGIEGNNDVLIIARKASNGIGYYQNAKIHKNYMSGLSTIRDMKIEELLKEE
jgi:ABC-type phosphate transport system ATPase subunit